MDTTRVAPRSAVEEPEQREECISFGVYTLWPRARILHDELGPVQLGGRALDLLIVLVSHAGEVVPKDELMRAVWPDVSVGEGNLRVHMTALRKALGSGDGDARYVVNVAGRGYSFVAPVSRRAPLVLLDRRNDLTTTRSNVIGRDELILSLGDRLQHAALVTLVGAGGMGKTTVAREVARRLMRMGSRPVHWVDLSQVPDDRAVAEECALALGLKCRPQEAVSAIVSLLQAKPVLLVLDCCERVVRGATLLVEKLIDELPQLALLATSREALRAHGEEVIRLPPLSLPADDEAVTAATAGDYAAIRLFIERAKSLGTSFGVHDADIPTVARLCTKLDGIPLAIELAAGHLIAFGLHDLVTILERRLTLVDLGRRTAEERHHTMQATLDWSYGLLSDPERLLIQRLSVFEGATTLRAIVAVTAIAPLGEAEVIQGVARLVDKSLLAVRSLPSGVAYRLLDTTRSYAASRLEEAGESGLLARRLAVYMLEEIAASRRIEGSKPLAEAWLGPSCPNLTNLRAAVSWASSNASEVALALDLISAAAPLLMQLSLLPVCEHLAAQGLALLPSLPGSTSEFEMHLSAFRGGATLGTRGPVDDALSTLESALSAAKQRGNVNYQGLVLSGLYWLWIYRGESSRAIGCAKTISTIDAEPDDSAASISAHYIAMATTQSGDQALASTLHAQAKLKSPHVNLGRFMRIGSDPGIFTKVFHVKTLWLVGQPEQALRLYEECLGALRAPEHALYICWALNEVMIPFHCDRRDWASASEASAELDRAARGQSMTIRIHAARAAARAIELLQGEGDLGAFEHELAVLGAGKFHALMPWLDGVLGQALARQGRTSDAIAHLQRAIDACRRSTNGWWLAELTRLLAEALDLNQPGPTSAGLETIQAAYSTAREQGALLLARRAAVSWMKLARQTNETERARAALRSTLALLPESTTDSEHTEAVKYA